MWGNPRLLFPAGVFLLAAGIFAAYYPVLHGGPVWDDEYMIVHNPMMTLGDAWAWEVPWATNWGTTWGTLCRIFFDLSANKVYYPLTLATLWIESRWFGLANLTGYHVVNVLLHIADVVLLWRLLGQLKVSGAFAIAAIWGLHPVEVESVAWITEHKNTLSCLFYLASMWALLRYFKVIGQTPRHPWFWYGSALLGFVLALAAKSTAVTLPAAVLLILWWKTGRIQGRQFLAIVPFLLVAIASGLLTQYIELHVTGSFDPAWGLSPLQAVVFSGRALWFYAGKLIWPVGLSFTYPRWEINPASAGQWIYSLGVAAVLLLVWKLRNRLGRGPITGLLFFCGTLAPSLGFFHVLFQRYSLVADHFQYLSGVGLIAILVAPLARMAIETEFKAAALTFVLLTLGYLTFVSSRRFESDQTVWASVLSADPSIPLANVGYAGDLITDAKYDQAMPYLQRAAATEQYLPNVWGNLGRMAEAQHNYDRAVVCYGEAAKLDPLDPAHHYQYGNMLLVTGQWRKAADQLTLAVRIQPQLAEAYDNLGVCFLHLHRREDALKQFLYAQKLKPKLPLIQRHLAEAQAR